MATDALRVTGRRLRATTRAFTLIEILVVVVIMGIAGAIVVPHMLRGGQLGLQAAARAAIADVLYAQNEAIAHQNVRRVVFDTTANQYRLTDGTGTTIGASWKADATAGENFVIDLDQDLRFQGVQLENVDFAGGTVLEFDALGSPTNGGVLELATDSFRYRITVAPFTGQVTIAPIEGG